MPATAEVIDLAEHRELYRISAAVMAANQHTELARMRRACGVIDATTCGREIASVLDELAQLRRDLELAVEQWPSNTETRNV